MDNGTAARHRSKQMDKNAIISLRILNLMAEGANVRDAIDAVLGEGTSKQMISDLYDQLRAKGSK
jgi:hypothetical protein